uniref:Uncharacterized protein n=1 Tax=Rhizophora mucronata TaxID=61149 RepID=A0A2P2P8G6_RHIMU
MVICGIDSLIVQLLQNVENQTHKVHNGESCQLLLIILVYFRKLLLRFAW